MISWQYPLVEAGTALSFIVLYLCFSLTPEFFVYLVYASFLIVIFTYDLRYYLILDKVTVPAMIVALILSVFVLEVGGWDLLYGLLIGGGFFLVQFLVSRGKWVGGGDIRLGALMGLMLGYKYLLVALFAAYVLGSVIGIFLILFGKKGWKSQVPFGTFLSVGAFIAFIFGQAIIDYYQELFII